MKVTRVLGCWGAVCGLLVAGLLLAGCRSQSSDPSFTNVVPGTAAAAVGAAGDSPAASQEGSSQTLKTGDTLIIVFSDLPQVPAPFEERINENGKITLLFNEIFDALGKTRGQLQNEIRERYVPKYYKYMTVIVKPVDQFYFVGGEVRLPNRFQYVGAMTVTKAIQSAGDFTDFANKRKVILTRASGRVETVNCAKALKDPRLDLAIYPGDKIDVPRRRW